MAGPDLRRQDKPGDFAATVLREYHHKISRRRNQGYGAGMIDQPATSDCFDVVIAGAGPTGLAMALALTHMLEDDVSVALVDRGPAQLQPAAQVASADPRAWALSNASKRFLEALGIWREVVLDGERRRQVLDFTKWNRAGLRATANVIGNGGHDIDVMCKRPGGEHVKSPVLAEHVSK